MSREEIRRKDLAAASANLNIDSLPSKTLGFAEGKG